MRSEATRTLLGLLSVAALAGCGDDMGTTDGGPPFDAGDTTMDAGETMTDAGETMTDAGETMTDGGTGADAGASCPGGGLAPGDQMLTLEHDGLTRSFFIHVPSGYDGSAPVPLVLNFHGYTSNATQQIGLTSMNDKADAEGFVAVHPEGTGLAQSWNAGLCCGAGMRDDVDDVGFVRALIDHVAGLVCVDRARVYATGMSNGGFLSHRLACEAADVIAAIAPVAGVMGIPMDECAPSRPVPVMHFHGTADAIVPYDGGGLTGFPSVQATIDGWTARNGCTDTAESTYDMGDSHCETYDACTGGVEVTLCTVEGGGHLWPGGFGSTSTIVATDHMWAFLSRFTL